MRELLQSVLRCLPAWFALALAACGNSNGFDLSTPLEARSDDVDRSIDLADATGPLPLDTPDDAARATIGARLFYSSVLDTLGGGTGSSAKSTTESCPDGGYRTEDKSSTSRAVRYDQCLDGFRYLDGFLSAAITGAGYPWSDAQAQLGEDDTPLLGENRDPGNDTRSLVLGTLAGRVKIDYSGDVQEIDAHGTVKGSESDLDGPPRMNYGMDDVRIDVQFDDVDYIIDESGPFRLTGDCGVGQASVATSQRIRVRKADGVVHEGVLQLSNASGQSAAATFNSDQSVDVTAGDVAQHYSLEEFRALCDF